MRIKLTVRDEKTAFGTHAWTFEVSGVLLGRGVTHGYTAACRAAVASYRDWADGVDLTGPDYQAPWFEMNFYPPAPASPEPRGLAPGAGRS